MPINRYLDPIDDGRADFLGPKVPHHAPLTPGQRREVERLQARSAEIAEQTYAMFFLTATLSLREGDAPEAIRAEAMAQVKGGLPSGFGDLVDETHVANVQNAVEDALAGREPRYPRWINMELLNAPEPPPGSRRGPA